MSQNKSFLDSIQTKTKLNELKLTRGQSSQLVSIPTKTIKSSPTLPKQVKSGQSDSNE